MKQGAGKGELVNMMWNMQESQAYATEVKKSLARLGCMEGSLLGSLKSVLLWMFMWVWLSVFK